MNPHSGKNAEHYYPEHYRLVAFQSAFLWLKLAPWIDAGIIRFILSDSPFGRRVQSLLKSVAEAEAAQKQCEWPADAPRPEERDENRFIETANEMFLGALGFIQLHEFGHIAHEHRADQQTPSDVFLAQEFEADEWAFTWVMGKWRDYESKGGKGNSGVFIKRTTILSNILALLACVRFYVPAKGVRVTHPNPIDRLLVFLTKYANEECALPYNYAWVMACTTLTLHLSNADDYDPSRTWETSRIFLNEVRPKFAHQGLEETVG